MTEINDLREAVAATDDLSLEQLRELPVWSVVRDANNDVFQLWPGVLTGVGLRWVAIGKDDYFYTPFEVAERGPVELLARGRREENGWNGCGTGCTADRLCATCEDEKADER